jgi:hypothetical protein
MPVPCLSLYKAADALLADADISNRLTPDALGALLAPIE